MRELELFKRPGVAETLDWTQALMALDRRSLDRETVHRTLGVLLKYQDDLAQMAAGGVDEAMGGGGGGGSMSRDQGAEDAVAG